MTLLQAHLFTRRVLKRWVSLWWGRSCRQAGQQPHRRRSSYVLHRVLYGVTASKVIGRKRPKRKASTYVYLRYVTSKPCSFIHHSATATTTCSGRRMCSCLHSGILLCATSSRVQPQAGHPSNNPPQRDRTFIPGPLLELLHAILTAHLADDFVPRDDGKSVS